MKTDLTVGIHGIDRQSFTLNRIESLNKFPLLKWKGFTNINENVRGFLNNGLNK